MELCMLLAVLFAVADLNKAQYCERNNEEDWSYHGSENGPQQWNEFYPECTENQSPIRIITDMVEKNRNLSKLIFIQYDKPVMLTEVVNDGRRVLLTPRDKVRRGILVEGSEYTLQYMQFHFGSPERPGAEHTINHIRYPMEIQFVHRNAANEYAAVALLADISDDVQVLERQSNGFDFLGTSIYTEMKHNPAFDPILAALPAVAFRGDSATLRLPLYLNAFLPESPASFYRYSGSLTTPPCNRAVWSVLKTMTSIGRHQLELFLGLFSVEREHASPECLMAENYRPAAEPRTTIASQ